MTWSIACLLRTHPITRRARWDTLARIFCTVLAVWVWSEQVAAQTQEPWQYLGPDGGRVFALAAHRSDPQVLYAATNYGLYQSKDGATTWTRLDAPTTNPVFRSVRVDPQKSNTVYAATSTGAFVSRDGGITWQEMAPVAALQPTLPPISIAQLMLFPQVPGRVFALTEIGAFVSDDEGASWTSFGIQGRRVFALTVDPQNPEIWFAGVWNSLGTPDPRDGGIYRSTDGGQSWAHVAESIVLDSWEHRLNNVGAIVKDVATQRWFARTDVGVIISANGGDTWALSDAESNRTMGFLYAAGTQILGSNGNGGLRISADGGQTWGAPNTPQVFFNDLLTADDFTWYAAGDAGVYKSMDGGVRWTSANVGIRAAGFSRLEIAQGENRLYAVQLGTGLYRYDFKSESWASTLESLPTAEPRFTGFRIDPRDARHLFLVGRKGFETRDGGDTWTALNIIVSTAGGTREVWPQDLAIDPSQSDVMYVVDGRAVSKTTDGGRTWALLLDTPLESPEYLATVKVSAADTKTLYVLGSRGLRQSTDAGVTWSDPVGISNRMGSLDLYPDPADANTLFVLRGTLRKSTDGGRTWRELAATQLGLVTDLVFDRRNPGTIYVIAPNTGLFVSHNNGETWSALSLNFLPIESPSALALDETNDVFYLATSDQGIWYRPLTRSAPVQPAPGAVTPPGNNAGVQIGEKEAAASAGGGTLEGYLLALLILTGAQIRLAGRKHAAD